MSAEPTPAKPAGKKPPLIPILAALVVLVGGGAFVFGQKAGAGKTKVIIKEDVPGIRVKLDEMVVNLRDPNQFIKATPEIEFKKEAPKGGGGEGEKAAEEFAPFMSRIEQSITLTFRATPVEKLNTAEGIHVVEKQMTERINETIEEEEGKVKSVVIGKFATQ